MRTEKRLTKKQYIKRYTESLMYQLCASLLSEEDAKNLTMKNVYNQFPKTSYFKDARTGMIKVGLSFRGVRKLVKRYPTIKLSDVKRYFNLGVS